MARMIIDLRPFSDPIEFAAAEATVNDLGVDAIWISPTAQGACLRVLLCLKKGHGQTEVSDALSRFEDSTWSR